MTKIFSYIAARLKSAIKGGYVTGAEDIIDDVIGKQQDVINSENAAAIIRIEEKADANRAEINAKQFEAGALVIDQAPTEDSENFVRSGAIYSFVKNEKSKEIVMPEGSTSAELMPNDLYIFGEVEELSIGFNPGEDDGSEKEYKFQFTCPPDIDTVVSFFPTGTIVRWANEDLEPEAGMTYQVSIVNGLGVYAQWEGVENE